LCLFFIYIRELVTDNARNEQCEEKQNFIDKGTNRRPKTEFGLLHFISEHFFFRILFGIAKNKIRNPQSCSYKRQRENYFDLMKRKGPGPDNVRRFIIFIPRQIFWDGPGM
jgi:hypothetical protein